MDQLYSLYDNTVLDLLQFILKCKYHLKVNSSALGFASDNSVRGSLSITNSSEISTFPIFTHRPFVYHRIDIMKKSKVIFLAPFNDEVWLALGLMLIVVTVSLTYVLAREARLRYSETGGRSLVRWDLSEMLLMTIGALCQQGTALNPQAPSSRTLFIVIFIMAALTYTAYNASIISLTGSTISSGSVKEVPTSLRVCEQPDFELDEMDEGKLKSRYGRKESEINLVDLSEGLIGVLQGSTVLLADRTTVRDNLHRYHRNVTSLCKVKETPLATREYRRRFPLGHSKYKRIIDHNLLRLREFGLLDRAEKLIFKTWPLCDGERNCDSEAVSINIVDIYPAFFLIGAGVVASKLILFMELGFFHCSKFLKRRQRGRKTGRNKVVARDRWARLKDTILCTKTQ